MATRIPGAGQDAALDAIGDRADADASPGLLRIYSGAQPADADDAASGDLLCEITLNDPAFAAGSGGSKALDASPALTDVGTALAGAGTDAGWFRIVDSDGSTTVVDGSITGTGGGGDIELDNISIAEDQNVTITGYTLTIPASE
jgi:hypothetical protein